MGLVRRMGDQWGDTNRSYMAAQQRISDVGGSLSAIARVLRMIVQSACSRRRRIPGDPSGGNARHHHRRIDTDCARARAGGSGHCQLAKLRRRAPELATPEKAAGAAARAIPADAPAGTDRELVGGERKRWPSRRAEAGRARCRLRAPARAGVGHCRAQRLGQVVAGALAGGSVASGSRQDLPGRRSAGTMVAGGAWPAHRLFAPGCRAVHGHRRAEHCPVRTPVRSRDHRQGGPRRRCPRAHRRLAERL